MALLKNKEITIGEVSFRIWELPNPKVFELIEDIRTQLSLDDLNFDAGDLSLLGELPAGATSEQIAARNKAVERLIRGLLGLIMSLPKEFVARLRKTLFEHIDYKNTGTSDRWIKLAGSVEQAFDRAQEGVGPFAMYQVLVEGFKLNFTDSGAGLTQMLGLGEG